MIYVVDTHGLIWFLERNPKVGTQAHHVLSDGSADVIVPTIVLAEIAFLRAHRRTRTSLSDVQAHVASSANCAIYPLDEAVVERLPASLNIHDGIIVATALVLRNMLGREVTVITRDAEIRSSGLVDVAW